MLVSYRRLNILNLLPVKGDFFLKVPAIFLPFFLLFKVILLMQV